MRLMQRTIVDLPQPDGPIIAVTLFGSNSRLNALDRVLLAVPGVEILTDTWRPAFLLTSARAKRSPGSGPTGDLRARRPVELESGLG